MVYSFINSCSRETSSQYVIWQLRSEWRKIFKINLLVKCTGVYFVPKLYKGSSHSKKKVWNFTLGAEGPDKFWSFSHFFWCSETFKNALKKFWCRGGRKSWCYYSNRYLVKTFIHTAKFATKITVNTTAAPANKK